MPPSTTRLFTIATVIELATALGLVVAPLLVLRLILGAGADPAMVLVARLTGIALFCLGLTTLFSRTSTDPLPGLAAMVGYNALVAAYLGYVGLTGLGGVLLWPIVLVHAALAVLFVMALRTR